MSRCKVGDLCVILSDVDFPENVGKLVTIVGTAIQDEYIHPLVGVEWECKTDSKLWGYFDANKTIAFCTTGNFAFEDKCLRPIRDQPGADETLSWKDVPQEVKA